MTSLLAIETSSEACSVAVSAGDDLLEAHEHAPLRHAELVLPAVERLLAEAGLSLGALDAIAFGCGPGSFTSLRIGIGVVQGLAWAAGVPVVPQSSLAALALEAANAEAAARGTRIRVAVDARMQEVFAGDFEADGAGMVKPVSEECVCPPGDLAERITQEALPFIAVGNGYGRFDALRPVGAAAAACRPDLWPRATMIIRLSEAWLRHNEPLAPALAQPVYIRNDVAEKPAAG